LKNITEAARAVEERVRSDAEDMRVTAAALDEAREALATVRAQVVVTEEEVMSYKVS
jgi:hypothetical protein